VINKFTECNSVILIVLKTVSNQLLNLLREGNVDLVKVSLLVASFKQKVPRNILQRALTGKESQIDDADAPNVCFFGVVLVLGYLRAHVVVGANFRSSLLIIVQGLA
jgi:hypothetical protein